MLDVILVVLWRRRVVIFLLCLAVFCYGVFRPESPPDFFPHSDKFLHVLAYFGLSGCAALAMHGRRHAAWTWVMLLLAAPGVEYLQHILQPARNFSLGDAAANLGGLLLAALVWHWARLLLRRVPQPNA